MERRIYNHLKYEDRFMMILSGKFIREILDLPQTFNVLCKARTSEEMGGALNPIPTGLCHVITVYGLIQPMAGRNRVKISPLWSKGQLNSE